LRLDNVTNQNLLGAIASGWVGPRTTNALQAALAGNLLTASQVSFLKGALANNTHLSPAQKAAIASALQADQAAKRRQNSGGSGTSGSGDGGGCGGSGDGGGGCPAGDGGDSPAVVTTASGDTEPAPEGIQETQAGARSGVKITELLPGTAADQGLRQGDIILSFGGTPTPTYEALCDVVQQVGSRAEVIFINSENGQTESVVLYPRNGRIGLSGETVDLN
jgi:hypothetical protein